MTQTDLAILTKKRRDDPRGFAIDAIGRLNSQRTGRPSCDAWIDYAVGQWVAFLNEGRSVIVEDRGAAEQGDPKCSTQ